MVLWSKAREIVKMQKKFAGAREQGTKQSDEARGNYCRIIVHYYSRELEYDASPTPQRTGKTNITVLITRSRVLQTLGQDYLTVQIIWVAVSKTGLGTKWVPGDILGLWRLDGLDLTS